MKQIIAILLTIFLTAEISFSADSPLCAHIYLTPSHQTFQEIRDRFQAPDSTEALYQHIVRHNGKDPTNNLSKEFYQDRPLTQAEASRIQAAIGIRSSKITSYESGLGKRFLQTLLALKSNQWWMDAGAGHLKATTDYLSIQEQSGGNVIAVTPTVDSTTMHAFNSTLNYFKTIKSKTKFLLIDKYVEDIKPVDLPKLDLISDLQGAFAYSTRPDLILLKYIQLLKVGGSAYVLIPGIPSLGITHSGKPGPPMKRNMSTEELENHIMTHYDGVMTWLNSFQSGIEFQIINNVLVMERTKDPIRYSPLRPETYISGRPPIRTFTWNPDQTITVIEPSSIGREN